MMDSNIKIEEIDWMESNLVFSKERGLVLVVLSFPSCQNLDNTNFEGVILFDESGAEQLGDTGTFKSKDFKLFSGEIQIKNKKK